MWVKSKFPARVRHQASYPAPNAAIRWICGLTASLAAFAVAAPVRACEISLGNLHITPVAYDPFSFATVQAYAEVEVRLNAPDTCAPVLDLVNDDLSPITHLSIGGVRPVQFDVRATGETAISHEITVNLSPDHPSETVKWELQLTRDAVVAPGDYQLPLAVTGRVDSQASREISRGQFILTALSRAQMNIAGASGAFGLARVSVLDFGQMSTGEQRQVFLQIRANSGVTARISSRNGGVMRNETMPSADPVSYSATLASRPLDLRSAQSLTLDPPPTIDGQSLPLNITLGPVEGKFAGQYSDVITIDISR